MLLAALVMQTIPAAGQVDARRWPAMEAMGACVDKAAADLALRSAPDMQEYVVAQLAGHAESACEHLADAVIAEGRAANLYAGLDDAERRHILRNVMTLRAEAVMDRAYRTRREVSGAHDVGD